MRPDGQRVWAFPCEFCRGRVLKIVYRLRIAQLFAGMCAMNRDCVRGAALFSLALVALASLSACNRTSSGEPTRTTASATVTASAATVTAFAQASASASSDAQFLSSLFERLEAEKKNRPTLELSAEKVLATLGARVKLEDVKQVAGWSVGARYCTKGVTKTDVHVVVCEFTDAASATKGVSAASATNAYIKRRIVLLKKSTSLSIQQAGESKEAESDAKKIADAFNAL
jgi:hypothetical protein